MNTLYPQYIHGISHGLVGMITPIIKEVYRLLGVFSKDFNDINKARFDADLLKRAYKIIVADLSQKKISSMIESQKMKSDDNPD